MDARPGECQPANISCVRHPISLATAITVLLILKLQPSKHQNPPAAPTLLLAQCVCWLRNTRLIIDWHNFGYSILSMKLGSKHPMVKLLRHHELRVCRFATANFCVSNAMARVLQEEVGIKAPVLVLHDRPSPLFQPVSSEAERFEFLAHLPETTDFMKAVRDGKRSELIDYAKLLACSSLGVCLHTSSSGVDLPMKVVDMFGAGLPVVAWDRYESWHELITDGVNGRGFGSAEELCNHLVDLLGEDRSKLQSLRLGARRESRRRWDDEWDPIAGRFLGLPSS
ncbi:hypothetical protein UREG_02969 [Uncinocarpus reesii 1704]|uniref:Chitobiosyldiphosphodolichol beta-mannosyltransferase n=1 Tax=Uncinocarpus reesii (strain UAMH 1704) TaxID=336963 RepID=C4JNH1_UNCRE|nr:uncharacterized protein UREG_02969 [Uncinocarpus reesii 1704]EEP78124.1 hypothetical protein UREG_02969 [Uncinocarpus reesii 1704]